MSTPTTSHGRHPGAGQVVTGRVVSGGTGTQLPPYAARSPFAVQGPYDAGTRPATTGYAAPRPGAPVVGVRRKSVLLAGVLGFFLGPIGMLYSTFIGATVMAFATVVALLIGAHVAAVTPFPVCALWAMWAAHRKNVRARAFAEFFGRV